MGTMNRFFELDVEWIREELRRAGYECDGVLVRRVDGQELTADDHKRVEAHVMVAGMKRARKLEGSGK